MKAQKEQIARRMAEAISPYSYVNVGIGLPTLMLPHLSGREDIMAHTENGAIGGVALPEGEEWDGVSVDPGKHPMGYREGASMFDSLEAFRLIHCGKLDLSIMGGYEVSTGGDLANWRRPNAGVGAIGGAADLAVGAREVWIGMLHNGPRGEPRLVEAITYPATARGCVSRVFTELGQFVPRGDLFEVVELAEGTNRAQLEAATNAPLSWSMDASEKTRTGGADDA